MIISLKSNIFFIDEILLTEEVLADNIYNFSEVVFHQN